MVRVSPQELFDEADRLEEEGQQDRALITWRQLAETHPTRNVFLRLASVTKDLGLIDDAEHAFKQALEIDGRSTGALMGLGSLAIDHRNYEAAESYLKKACEIEEYPAGYTLLGVALRNNGKDLDAEEAYRRAIRIDPKYEEAYYNLGVLLKFDRSSEAQMLFRRAVELDPDYACAYRELGMCSASTGLTRKAKAIFERPSSLNLATPGHIFTSEPTCGNAPMWTQRQRSFGLQRSLSRSGLFRFGPWAISIVVRMKTSIWPNRFSSELCSWTRLNPQL
jgi:tetratricopeptide (TPR) repeat protein